MPLETGAPALPVGTRECSEQAVAFRIFGMPHQRHSKGGNGLRSRLDGAPRGDPSIKADQARAIVVFGGARNSLVIERRLGLAALRCSQKRRLENIRRAAPLQSKRWYELGSHSRQLETGHGPGQGTVGQADATTILTSLPAGATSSPARSRNATVWPRTTSRSSLAIGEQRGRFLVREEVSRQHGPRGGAVRVPKIG